MCVGSPKAGVKVMSCPVGARIKPIPPRKEKNDKLRLAPEDIFLRGSGGRIDL